MECLGPATHARWCQIVRSARTSLIAPILLDRVSGLRQANAASVLRTKDGYGCYTLAELQTSGIDAIDEHVPPFIIGPRPPISPEDRQPEAQRRSSPIKHRYSRINSLARALRLEPPQVAAMLRDYPALANYNHGQLADKLLEMAQLLQLQPDALSQALVTKPKILGLSLAEFESRVRELSRLFGPRHMLSQLILQEPKLLSWSVHHLKQRLTNMSACLGVQQHELLLLIRNNPQLLPASSNLVKCLQLMQQLVQMADAASQKGFGLLHLPLQQQQHQQQSLEQQQLMRQMTLIGQQIQQQTQQQQQHLGQQQQQLGPEVQQLQQRLQQLQLQLQHIQQQQQNQVSWNAAQRLVLQHPLLLLLPPEHILAQLATMQAQSGLSVVEVAAVVVEHPQLIMMDRDFASNPNSTSLNIQQQQQQQQQQWRGPMPVQQQQQSQRQRQSHQFL